MQIQIYIPIPKMVSKFVKRTTPKSIKSQKRRLYSHQKWRKSSSTKKTSSVSVFSSINKSFFTCRRRLIKLFTKLSGLESPNRSRRGFKILPHDESDLDLESGSGIVIPRALSFDEDRFRLPPLDPIKQGTVFLDLDETLIHSSPDPPPESRFDFTVRPVIEGKIMKFYVSKRPGVDQFLKEISKKFELVVFTAGIEPYAMLVLDALDPKGLISHRLYRDSCRELEGRYVKDLAETGRDLRKSVIVDDNPNSYSLQQGNAIPIIPFEDDVNDRELEKLVEFFSRMQSVERHEGGGGAVS